jgi:hypothetical protein
VCARVRVCVQHVKSVGQGTGVVGVRRRIEIGTCSKKYTRERKKFLTLVSNLYAWLESSDLHSHALAHKASA